MQKLLSFLTLFIGLIALQGCKKETVEASFDDVFHKPYVTGIIKFQHGVTSTISGGSSSSKDTIVSFTSLGSNPAYNGDRGYFTPSMVILGRYNPENYDNNAWIKFDNINLDTLSVPYKFRAGNQQNGAEFLYSINHDRYIEDQYGTGGFKNFYQANNYTNSLDVTILSKANNRLQGTFSAVVKNSRGLTINIKKGLFDVEVVKK